MVDDGASSYEIAELLGVSVSMVSGYKLHQYNPSLEVAKNVYKKTNVVLHPFAEQSLKLELGIE